MGRLIAIVMNSGGARLDRNAVASAPVHVDVLDVVRWKNAACLMAVMDVAADEMKSHAAIRRWASSRGWTLTLAPLFGAE